MVVLAKNCGGLMGLEFLSYNRAYYNSIKLKASHESIPY